MLERIVCVSILAALAGAGTAGAQDFGYSGPIGPDHWGGLSPAWETCATGHEQSPIDVGEVTRRSKRVRTLALDYHTSHGAIFNNGHTIEVETEGENVLTLNGVHYRLIQFHFHTPSEHTAEGRGYDMELHLVHRSPAGALAVVGVLMQRGGDSGALEAIFEHLPDVVGVHEELEERFNPRAFLPGSLTHYRYRGSLTTPPCSESVSWMVLEDAVTISDEHMARFAERVRFNARPVQRRSR